MFADGAEKLVADSALEEFSEWLAERKNLPEVFGREIRASDLWIRAFAADLYNADNAIAGKNRRANDFLDEFRVVGRQFYSFEYTGVFHGSEIIDNFGTAFSRGAGGECRFAGERDESHIFQRLRHDKMQMSPTMRDSEYRYFVGTNRKIVGNAFRNRSEGELLRVACFVL